MEYSGGRTLTSTGSKPCIRAQKAAKTESFPPLKRTATRMGFDDSMTSMLSLQPHVEAIHVFPFMQMPLRESREFPEAGLPVQVHGRFVRGRDVQVDVPRLQPLPREDDSGAEQFLSEAAAAVGLPHRDADTHVAFIPIPSLAGFAA